MRGRTADVPLCRRFSCGFQMQRVIADGGASGLHGDLDGQHIIKPPQFGLLHAACKLPAQILLGLAADLFLKCAVEFFPVAFWLFFRIHGVPSHVYCIQYTTTIL